MALSQAMEIEPNVQPLEHLGDNRLSAEASGYRTAFIFGITLFTTCVIAICSVCFMIPEPEPESSGGDDSESESESARRRRYMFTSLSEASDVEYWQSLHHHEISSSDSDVEAPQVALVEAPQVALDERIPLRPSIMRCYILLSASFARLKQVLIQDPRQRGRGFAVLYQLQQVLAII